MLIYKAQNKINGKIYIDQTKYLLENRIKQHFISGSLLHKALKKYGIENFDILVIDSSDNQEELNEKERYWIKFYSCRSPNGYNLTGGGDGTFYLLEEIRKRTGNRRPRSEETKRKISESCKGKRMGDSNPAKMPQAREKHRQLMQGENNPSKKEEVKDKIRASVIRNYEQHPELKNKISEKTKEAMKKPEIRQKFLEGMEKKQKRQLAKIRLEG